MFVLLGCVCAAPAAAPATCPLEADWSTVWLPTDGVFAAAMLTPVVSESSPAVSAMRHRLIPCLLHRLDGYAGRDARRTGLRRGPSRGARGVTREAGDVDGLSAFARAT